MKILKNSNFIIGVITVCVFSVIGFVVYKTSSTDVKLTYGLYDSFASCITESGAKFYGSRWCPACNRQKEDFGASAALLPYVECSVPNGREQTIPCKKEGIEAYPTWRFTDGTEVENKLSFEELAKKTGCDIPEEGLDVEN